MNRADRGLWALTIAVVIGFTIAMWDELSLFVSVLPH